MFASTKAAASSRGTTKKRKILAKSAMEATNPSPTVIPSRGAVTEAPSRVTETYDEARRAAMEAFHRRYLTQALKDAGDNVSAAARNIGIGRTALHRLLKRYGIRSADGRK